jgi:hypothetical protein
MKKILTLVLMLAIVLSVSAQQKKKVGYYGLDKSSTGTGDMAPNAQTDPVLIMLQSDPKLEVTANLVNDMAVPAPVGWNNYDVVVLNESNSSGGQMLFDMNINAVTKPYLIGKTYGFRAGSLFTTGAGGGIDGVGVDIKVVEGKESNDLFKGITISGGLIKCFDHMTDGTGLAEGGTKALIHNETVVVGAAGTLLAMPNGVTTTSISFNDIPAGTSIGDDAITQNRVITLGLNYAAICADGNITNACKTIWRNAVYILAGLAVPSTPTSVTDIKTSALTYIYNNNQVLVNFGVDQQAEVAVYNTSGRLVSKTRVNSLSATIEMGGQPQGIYLVTVSGSKVSGTQKILMF